MSREERRWYIAIGYIVDNELRGCDSLDVRRIAANLF